jgi:hypothetical protein
LRSKMLSLILLIMIFRKPFVYLVYDEYNNYDEADFQKTSEISFHRENDSFQ